MALSKRQDVQFFEIINLELEQHCTRNVIYEELVNCGFTVTGNVHPVSDLAGGPVPDLFLIDMRDVGVHRREVRSGWCELEATGGV